MRRYRANIIHISLLLFIGVIAFSCTKIKRQVPEPEENPWMLKAKTFVPSQGLEVSLDTSIAPIYVSAKGKQIKANKKYLSVPEEIIVAQGTFVPGKPIFLEPSSIEPPEYFPAKGKKIMFPWPKWNPTQPAYPPSPKYPYFYMDMEQGLISSAIQDILKDSKNRVWIAGKGGLSMWDGKGLMHFNTAPGLIGRDINRLMEDKQGRLWIGTRGAGIFVWDGSTLTQYTTEEGLIHDLIDCFWEDRQGNIWIGSVNAGISKWDGKGFTNYGPKQGISHHKGNLHASVWNLLEDSQGRMWVTTTHGVNVIHGDSIFVFNKKNGLSHDNTKGLMEDDAGNIWIANGKGVDVYNGEGFIHYSSEDGLTGDGVRKFAKGIDGKIYMSDGNGFTVWDGKMFRHYDEEDGFRMNRVFDLMADDLGNIWIGTKADGLMVWNTRGPNYFSQYKGFGRNPIFTIKEDSKGNIWAKHFVWEQEKFYRIQQEKGLFNSNTGLSITEDKKGNMWIMGRRGLSYWDGKTFTNYQNRAASRITALAIDQLDSMYFAVERKGLATWDGEKISIYGRQHGLVSDSITTMLVDRKNRLWLGTEKGLCFKKDQTFYHFTAQNGLLNERIKCLAEDQQGNIWIGTNDGLSIWNGEGFWHYTESQGLSANVVLSLFADKDNAVWLGTSQGLDRFMPTKVAGNFTRKTFTQEEGFKGSSILGILVDSKRQLWVGSNKGIERIDLDAQVRDTTPPSISFREVRPFFDQIDWRQTHQAIAQGKKVLLSEEELDGSGIRYDSVRAYANIPHNATFPYHINEMTLSWNGMHWSAPNKLRYRYILEGKDHAWSPPIDENKISYHGLSPGSYTFKVKAIGSNGKWSKTASYSFKITPPWWMTWWAYLIYALIGSSIVYFIAQVIINQQKRKLQNELTQQQKLNQRLRQVDLLKDQFLANTSHELRTPLNGIIGLSEAIYERAGSKEDKENLSLIISSGKRLSSMVNDLLDFSKLKNFDLALNLKPIDLYSLVDVVARINKPSMDQKGLAFINTISHDLGAVHADENRLQQILHNLVGNAIKFTNSGSVSVRAIPDKEGFVRIEVVDTGIGIPKEKQAFIFEEFRQADASTSRKYGGTGLGLTISQQLVHLHGGDIGLESEEGIGTTFWFTLPISEEKGQKAMQSEELVANMGLQASLAESPVPPLVNVHGGEGFRILIVDDELINQQVLKNHLIDQAFELAFANDGQHAMEVLENSPKFDLVLLDIMMPNMSGYEVCERIRERYLPSELPIIMITAKNQTQDLVQGLGIGANDYLVKPFSKQELLARVKTQLDLYRIFNITGKFIPYEFIHSLGKERITEVDLGDYAEKEVTVLFLDIRDYTPLSEQMSPEDNYRFVNAFHGRMGPIIRKNNGFVNQYLGDAIMVVFPDNPQDALQAAIEMQQTLQQYNVYREKKGRIPIRMGIGMQTGPLIMGIIGDKDRLEAASISDTVNTASRIENLSKHYGTNILLSNRTLKEIRKFTPNTFHTRFLGKVKLKGKAEPTDIYECIDGEEPMQKERKMATGDRFESGMQHYQNREFPEAMAAFTEVLKDNPSDRPAQLFLQKVVKLISTGVPESWSEVENLDHK